MTDRKLYYSPGACSLAAHIALEEAGLAFEPRPVDFASAEQRSPDYLAMNPKGRVPVLVDDGFVLTECAAILRYVARRAPEARLWPEAPGADARCAEWLAWCASGLHPTYAHVRRPERYATDEAARADVVATGRIATRQVWEAVEDRLAAKRTTWVADDDYSVADPYLFTFWIWGRSANLGYDMPADFPAWTDHARRMDARPAVRAVLAREGLQPV